MWYLFAENEVFVGERRDESLSNKLLSSTKQIMIAFFCKSTIRCVYINNQKGKIYGYVSAISASVTNYCIRRREQKESRNFSKTLTGKELMKIIRGLAQAFGKIPPIITVSADQI